MNDSSVRFHLSRDSKKRIYTSTLFAVILVLTLGQRHAGFLVFVLVLPFTAWFTYSAYVIVRRPYARWAQLIRIFIWVVAFVMVADIHYIWHKAARVDADQIALAVSEYSEVYGRCPQSLETLGIKREQLAERLGENFGYSCIQGKPKFFYVATFTIFDTFAYDFDEGTWEYESWAEKKKFLDTRPPGLRETPGKQRRS
ncbi:MAG: hypothetical protein NTW45_10370 [Rhodocyclales bacterium]|nr:hypothetical protein [Rhodocyclales bacterium]